MLLEFPAPQLRGGGGAELAEEMWREREAGEVSWQELQRIRGVLARPCSISTA